MIVKKEYKVDFTPLKNHCVPNTIKVILDHHEMKVDLCTLTKFLDVREENGLPKAFIRDLNEQLFDKLPELKDFTELWFSGRKISERHLLAFRDEGVHMVFFINYSLFDKGRFDETTNHVLLLEELDYRQVGESKLTLLSIEGEVFRIETTLNKLKEAMVPGVGDYGTSLIIKA